MMQALQPRQAYAAASSCSAPAGPVEKPLNIRLGGVAPSGSRKIGGFPYLASARSCLRSMGIAGAFAVESSRP